MDSIQTRKTRLGELLVQRGFLDEAQLVKALDHQKTQMPAMSLGEICVGMGFFSQGALNGILEKYHTHILLGDLFLNLGIVSVDQMHQALEAQRRTKKKLGEVLIAKRFITKTQLADALSVQLGIPRITPNASAVDMTLLSQATVAFFQKNSVVPLWRDEAKNAVVVLMDDPLDAAVITDLKKVFWSNIQPAISTTIDAKAFLREVLDAWNRYRGAEQVSEAPPADLDAGTLPFHTAQKVDFDKKESPDSELRLAEDNSIGAGTTPPPRALDAVNAEAALSLAFRSGKTSKDQPAALRISARKTAEGGPSCSLGPSAANMLDLSAINGQNVELSSVRKDMVVDDRDSNSVVAKDNAVAILNFIIFSAADERASDIHIEPFEGKVRVRYRVDGVLRHKTDLPKSIAAALTSRIKVLSGLDIAERRRHQDGRIEARVGDKDIDLRVSTYAALWGENVVIRVLNRATSLVDLNNLGLSPLNLTHYRRVLAHPAGIVLVTGPTGCGKTTTLYASLIHLNNGSTKIITVEDPVEYTIDGVVQGRLDSRPDLSYEDFIKSMMRQDPDIIMIGEIRDEAGAAAAIQASLTGHKVFTSFHTEDTVSAILRLGNMGIEPFLISSTVTGIMSQRLARTLCPFCKLPATPDESVIARFTSIEPGDSYEAYTFYRAVGCPECDNTGYKGRTGIHELLEINKPVKEAIRAKKTESKIRLTARESAHFISMAEDGFYKAAMGITTLEDVLRVVPIYESDSEIPFDMNHLIAFCNGTDNKNAVQMPRMNSAASAAIGARSDRPATG